MVHQTRNTSTARAASASRINSHMRLAILGGLALLLAACAGPAIAPAPVAQRPPAAVGPPGTTPLATPGTPGVTAPGAVATVTRSRARWVAAAWADLPGFEADRAAEVWPALLAGCARPAPGWNELCARALLDPPQGDDATRRWLQAQLQPWRVEALDGNPEGLATGYFEPSLDARRRPDAVYRVPLHAPPADLASRKPFFTRQQLDTVPAAMATLRERDIAWLDDPLDALLLQVQGSGRLRITEPDGRISLVRLAFAGHNDQPYRSLGRWLIDQGELSADAASWPAIKAWALQNPARVSELLWANPRVVFFREEALGDPRLGPRGAQGVPLTPGRSVAVDPLAVPHGSLLWVDSTEPLSSTPLRRLVMAQDSGNAIIGAVRIDLFFGWGREAEARAGRMKQALRVWVLWPRGAVPGGTVGTTAGATAGGTAMGSAPGSAAWPAPASAGGQP